MELALMTEPQLGGTYQDLLDAARWAEANGFVAFARSDHYYWSGEPADANDAFTTFGGIARETSTIRLVVLVSPLTFRHPAVIAKAAASLDEMSGGRFDLGLGTGWMEMEHEVFGLPFPEWSERFERLEEALPYVRAALRDDHASFTGKHYRIDASVRPLAPSVGLVVGGSGPKRTPRLAGRWADEYNAFVAPPETLAPRIAELRRSAEEHGRDPAGIRVSVMGGGFWGEDEAAYRAELAEGAAKRDLEPSEFEAQLAERGAFHGPVDRVREQLAALDAVGVDRWYVQVIPHDLGNVERVAGPLV